MEQTTKKTAIEKLLFLYGDTLNSSDVNKVLPLYTNDGVFMPSNALSVLPFLIYNLVLTELNCFTFRFTK